MDIQPIRTEADYEAALERVGTLMGAVPDTPEGDELDVLVTLIEKYEETHYPIKRPDAVQAVEFAMEHMGRTRSELVDLIGSNRASEFLNRKRKLTMDQARLLHGRWNIPAEVFLVDYKLAEAPAPKKWRARYFTRGGFSFREITAFRTNATSAAKQKPSNNRPVRRGVKRKSG